MAITTIVGFESRTGSGVTVTGTCTFNTSTVHTAGGSSVRCNPASGGQGFVSTPFGLSSGYVHFAMYIAIMPSVDRRICDAGPLLLQSDGRLSFHGTTGSAVLTTGQWYWIGIRLTTGGTEVGVRVNGVDDVTTSLTSTAISHLGCAQTEASAIDIYFDDYVVDNAGFIDSTLFVSLLRPSADSARAAKWLTGNAGTTNLWDAVNNTPPAGVASASETATSNIEHSGSGAGNEDYDATMTSYSTAGVAAGATVVALVSLIRHGEDIATGTKTLQFGLTSNPSESLIAAFNVGGDSGAHAADTAAGFWRTTFNAVATSPSVTLGTSPVFRVRRNGTEARVACVDFVGVYAAWTAAVDERVPFSRPYRQHLAH